MTVKWLMRVAIVGFAVATGLLAPVRAQPPASDGPMLQDGNHLAFPDAYREWVFLSAGLGMNYGPNAPAAGQPQSFTNVYVNPSSYRAFMKTGTWPDRTMFVLEIRGSASEGSINRSGRYQTDLRAIEANVKDARLPGGWGFYDFGRNTAAVAPLPQTGTWFWWLGVFSGVVHTLVLLFAAVLVVARRMGTVKKEFDEAGAR
jgi:hypothetical protein